MSRDAIYSRSPLGVADGEDARVVVHLDLCLDTGADSLPQQGVETALLIPCTCELILDSSLSGATPKRLVREQ